MEKKADMISTLWSYFKVASDGNQLCEWLLGCFVEFSNILDDLASRGALSQISHRNLNSQNSTKFPLGPLTYVTYSYSYSLWALVQKSNAQGKELSHVYLCNQLWREGVGGGAGGTCGANMAGGPVAPREVGNIVSWAETPKVVHYKFPQQAYKELNST